MIQKFGYLGNIPNTTGKPSKLADFLFLKIKNDREVQIQRGKISKNSAV